MYLASDTYEHKEQITAILRLVVRYPVGTEPPAREKILSNIRCSCTLALPEDVTVDLIVDKILDARNESE